MRTLLVAVAAVLLLVSVQPAAAQVVGSLHDLSSSGPGATSNVDRVCVFCHTPHQAAAASSQDPLWNHTIATGSSYTLYNSATFNASQAATSLNTPTVGTAAVSNLCLSCHDGTVAVSSLYNAPNELGGNAISITAGGNVTGAGLLTGNPLMGTNLSDDHPVNITYNAALESADGGLNPANSAAVAALLFNSTVQCASCHDPHDTTNAGGPFMVVDNTGSALCTTCHAK